MSSSGGRGEVTSDINVTPMADVMLVLLIIFMVITPMLQKGQTVDLAKTRNPVDMTEADKEDSVLVAVTRDGKYFLNQDQVHVDDLTTKVTDLLTDRLDKTIFIKGDYRAKYADILKVVTNLRAAGVDKMGLLTERIDEKVMQ
jgi:biopolymer transport protein ExbD/biopolymer transport protein TolR